MTITKNNNKMRSKTFKTLSMFPNPLVPFNKWNYFFFYKIVNGFSLDLLGSCLNGISVFCVSTISKAFSCIIFQVHMHTHENACREAHQCESLITFM